MAKVDETAQMSLLTVGSAFWMELSVCSRRAASAWPLVAKTTIFNHTCSYAIEYRIQTSPGHTDHPTFLFATQILSRVPLMALLLVGMLCLSGLQGAQADLATENSVWDSAELVDHAFEGNMKTLSHLELRKLHEAVESRDLNLLADATLKDPSAL